MVEIISTGKQWHRLGRQADDAFCKVVLEDCVEDTVVVKFGDREFDLNPGIWYLYWANDTSGVSHDGRTQSCSLQPDEKWNEVLRAQAARRIYWRARQDALAKRVTVTRANESAQRYCERFGFTMYTVQSAQADEHERRLKAADIFKADHGLPVGRLWQQGSQTHEGKMRYRATFLPTNKAIFPEEANPGDYLEVDVWGNLLKDKKILVYIQDMVKTL